MNADLTHLLIDSDRRYFAAGTESVPFAGGVLHWMPGLQHTAAGCVAELADLGCIDAASAAAATVGAAQLRFYTPAGVVKLRPDGFITATELAYACEPHALVGCPPITVRAVQTTCDWTDKQTLAAAFDNLPDGKHTSAHDWTELERRKNDAGYAQFYLAEIAGEVCAAFAIADCRPLLRLKNLVVHPRFRRQGIGRAVVDFAMRCGLRNRFEWIGVFALENGPGSRLYASCGLELVGAQTEWIRPVPAPTTCGAPAMAMESS